MFETTQLMAQGYRTSAPTDEVEEMDAMVVERRPCRKCGGAMRYRGYHERSRSGYCEYVAMAVCSRCGHKIYI